MDDPSPRLSLGMVAAGVVIALLGLLLSDPARQAVVILGLMILLPGLITVGWGRARPPFLRRNPPE